MSMSAAISALIAVSGSGAPLEIPDWVVGIFAISALILLLMLSFRIFKKLIAAN